MYVYLQRVCYNKVLLCILRTIPNIMPYSMKIWYSFDTSIGNKLNHMVTRGRILYFLNNHLEIQIENQGKIVCTHIFMAGLLYNCYPSYFLRRCVNCVFSNCIFFSSSFKVLFSFSR